MSIRKLLFLVIYNLIFFESLPGISPEYYLYTRIGFGLSVNDTLKENQILYNEMVLRILYYDMDRSQVYQMKYEE